MQGKTDSSDRMHRALSILGMAATWPSLHNQLLYPIAFSFHKEGASESLGPYLLYSVFFMLTAVALALFNRREPENKLFSSKPIVIGANLMGAIGISLLVLCDFGSDLAWALTGIGTAFSAMFAPIAFVFWSLQLIYSAPRTASFSLAISYLVFCVVVMLRLFFGLHSWFFAIACPVASTILAAIVLRRPAKMRFGQHPTPLREQSRSLAIPALALVYVATICRFIANPIDATYDFPPMHRVLIYLYAAIFMVPLIFLHRPKTTNHLVSNIVSFVIITIALVGGLLLTGMGLITDDGFGNFPAIAGANLMSVFLWMLILESAQSKHSGIIGVAAAYLVLAVGLPHLGCALFLFSSTPLDPIGASQINTLIITTSLAFLAVAIAMTVMTWLLFGRTLKGAAGPNGIIAPGAPLDANNDAVKAMMSVDPALESQVPPCIKFVSDEMVFRTMKDRFHLSQREVDTLRLAARNKTAKEIAEGLYVAESTVNSHIKGIYRKCDVHSRQELLALIDRYRKECATL